MRRQIRIPASTYRHDEPGYVVVHRDPGDEWHKQPLRVVAIVGRDGDELTVVADDEIAVRVRNTPGTAAPAGLLDGVVRLAPL